MSGASEGPREIASFTHSLQRQWKFDSALPLLADHFPGMPILPAFYQMYCVRREVGVFLGCSPQRIKIKSMKFLRPITPQQRVELSVERKGRGSSVVVQLISDGTVFSQGEMELV